jgi:hypothetical protein
MRFTALKSFLAAIVVTTAASGHIARAETTLKVPFSFTVSGHAMPAGVYTVQESTFHNMVIFRNQDSTQSYSYTLQPGDDAPSAAHVALKFEAAGDQHVLRSIQFGSKTTSRLDKAPAPGSYEPARLSQGR